MTGLYPPAHGVRDNGNYALGPRRGDAGRAARARPATGPAPSCRPLVLAGATASTRDSTTYDDDLWSEDEPKLFMIRDRPGGADRRTGRSRGSTDWRGARRGGQPFFLWMHLFDPHQPYDVRAARSRRARPDPLRRGDRAGRPRRGPGDRLARGSAGVLDDTLVDPHRRPRREPRRARRADARHLHLRRDHPRARSSGVCRGLLPRGHDLPRAGAPRRHRADGPRARSGCPAARPDAGGRPAVRPPGPDGCRRRPRRSTRSRGSPRWASAWRRSPGSAHGGWKWIRAPRPELYDLRATRGELDEPLSRRRPPTRARSTRELDARPRRQRAPRAGRRRRGRSTPRPRRCCGPSATSRRRSSAPRWAGMDPKDGMAIYASIQDARQLAQSGQWDRVQALLARGPRDRRPRT